MAALQRRKALDVPTTSGFSESAAHRAIRLTVLLALLMNQITTLTDALSGLERILTTPIPVSYSFHLWSVSILYVGSLVRIPPPADIYSRIMSQPYSTAVSTLGQPTLGDHSSHDACCFYILWLPIVWGGN